MSKENYMARCIELAQKGAGYVSPNPLVGALIVKDGKVIGEGYHQKFGDAHAEINAINSLNDKELILGSEIYVTLEPCSHFGKTPPCSDRIIKENFSKVYVGSLDPNPLVAGKGIEKIRKAGIEVETGILEEECNWQNRFFRKHIVTNRPYVILKIAQSIDGFVAKENQRTQITGIESQKAVHELRSQVDAVLVGKRTIEIDDPELTVRLVNGRNPKRVVLDKNSELNPGFKIFSHNPESTIIAKFSESPKNISNVSYINVLRNESRIDLRDLLVQLGKRFNSILVEAGPSLAESLLSENLVDELQLFISPLILKSGIPPFFQEKLLDGLKPKNGLSLGNDFCLTYLKY